MPFKTPRLVVRTHRPGRQLLLTLAGALVLVIAAWMAFEYGQWQQIYARMSSLTRFDGGDESSAEAVQSLQAENADLRQRVTILERAAQVDRAADDQLKSHLRTLQDETYTLREELEFYRKVVGRAKDGDGLRVQAVKVDPMSDPRRFHYKLVLTNLNKDDKVTQGDATIEVAGKSGGQPQKFKVTTVQSGTRTANLAFSFVHFHRLEGDFTLPVGFTPESVRVTVRQQANAAPLQDNSYDWNALVKAEG
jgi:hypothetical protein